MKASKKLAIIGAGYLQLPLVRKAKTMDIATVCFAWEEGAMAKDECDKFYPISIVESDQIFRQCMRENVDGVVSIASDVAVPTVSHVAEHMNLVGNSISSAKQSTNKFSMRESLSCAGLLCPRYRFASCARDAASVSADLRFPLIVKPVDRSGSLGVTKVLEATEVKAALNLALDLSFLREAIVEEFVEGVEVSVETVSWDGVHYHLTITDKETSGSPHFVELAHHQPSALPESVCRRIREQTAAGLNALGVSCGASHAEFIVTQEDIYVTEIGARMGGDFIGSDLVPLSTGYDYLRGVIEIALGRFTAPRTGLGMCSGVYFYSRETPEVLNMIHSSDSRTEIIRAECTGRDLPPLRSSGDRRGYAIYQSEMRLLDK